MHKRFEELIPFYIAQTLPEADRRAVEAYLAQSKEARQTLAEWQAIANAVYDDAAKKAVGLPPLSPQVRQAIQQPRAAGSTVPTRETQRVIYPPPQAFTAARRLPVTLVAALLTLILFGGLVAYMATRSPIGTQGSGDGTSVAMLTEEVGSPTPTPTPLTPTATRDLGIVNPTPIPQGDSGNTVAPAPQESQTFENQSFNLDAGTETSTGGSPDAQIRLAEPQIPTGDCILFSRTGAEVSIHRSPSLSTEVIGVLQAGQTLVTWVYSGDGWYQVFIADQGTVGWVSAALIQLSGSCNTLPLPSPTASDGASFPQICSAQTLSTSVNLYAGPGRTYDVLNTLGAFSLPEVLARSDNGWLRVKLMIGSIWWTGWLAESDLTLLNPCNLLPVIPSAGYPPEAAPIYEQTMPSSTPTAEPPPESTLAVE